MGQLKNFKALDYIQNRHSPHLNIDTRIAAAMLNFTHKPFVQDKPKTKTVAQRLLKKMNKYQINKLSFLFNQRFPKSLKRKNKSTYILKPVSIDGLSDFPILTKNQIDKKLNMGTYKTKISPGYIHDICLLNKAYFLDPVELVKKIPEGELYDKLRNDFKDPSQPLSKILAVEVPSRMTRGTRIDWTDTETETESEFGSVCEEVKIQKKTYKVYINYGSTFDQQEDPKKDLIEREVAGLIDLSNIVLVPSTNHRLIKYYFCTCMSGHGIVGGCAHVISVIYYLAYGQYHPEAIINPAEAVDDIFVDPYNYARKSNKPK